MRWKDLEPDEAMLTALSEADAKVPRATALTGTRPEKLNWSSSFADACAKMVACEVRKHQAFRRFNVLPDSEGTAEPPTFIAADKTKKVDVVVSSSVSGLQVGFSLKGMNFRDRKGNQFDKNLTGRTYELQDEVRLIHEYQPASFLVALYFLPLGATVDKGSDTTPSSFARAVKHLRERTERLDPFYHSHMARADMSFVAVYVPGDVEDTRLGPYSDAPIARGVVRYFDVFEDPPMRGRPVLDSTLSLGQFVDRVAQSWLDRGKRSFAYSAAESEE